MVRYSTNLFSFDEQGSSECISRHHRRSISISKTKYCLLQVGANGVSGLHVLLLVEKV